MMLGKQESHKSRINENLGKSNLTTQYFLREIKYLAHRETQYLDLREVQYLGLWQPKKKS